MKFVLLVPSWLLFLFPQSTDIISQSKFAVAVNVTGQGVLSLAQCQLAQASLSFDFYITC